MFHLLSVLYVKISFFGKLSLNQVKINHKLIQFKCLWPYLPHKWPKYDKFKYVLDITFDPLMFILLGNSQFVSHQLVQINVKT